MSKKKPERKVSYIEILQAEELDRLQENARSHRINNALAGTRCPSREGVVRLLNKKRGEVL